jgi:serine/threonine protein kinase/WD40 repeat protein
MVARALDLQVVPSPPAAESRIGTILDGRYRLDAVLGTGGFGAVYRARHLLLDHDVAIKLLHGDVDPNAIKRLTREGKILARLDHLNCVRIMDFGGYEGAPYLVMELIAGRSLDQQLGRPWAPRRAVDVTIELLAGLAHAHALNLVHRDLKPSNVLLADGPDGSIVKIIDFGIVAVAAGEQLGSFTEQLTATGKIIGTPRYMSPEQLLGARLDARSDLYAVGLILFEMLAGHTAFEATDARRLAWLHAVAPPPPLPDEVPDELAQLVEELLAKSREGRPATAVHVRERLLAMRSSLPDEPSEPRAPEQLAADAADNTTVTGARQSVPGRQVGRFLLLRELGRGAMGVVHLAWDEALDRQVAVKLMRTSLADQRASERMVREARALARVTHPNVVGVFELGSHQGTLFVAMQYVRGRTLRAWQSERPRAWTETLARLVEAGRGLAAVHATGLIHRDFKPDNVLVGDDERARVVDFGLVRSISPALDMIDRVAAGPPDADVDPLEAKLTRTGAIIGTPAYMALEQLAGDQVDARSDQFAFCVVAYEALHGQRPFVGRSLEELAANLTAGRLQERERTVPRKLDEVLARGLQVMPASRWPNMDALLDALEHAGGMRERWPIRGLIAGAIGLALVGLAAWALGDEGQTEPSVAVTDRAPIRDEDLEARNRELAQALDVARAQLARARPEHPDSWRDVIELTGRHRGAATMSLDLRAALHAVAGAMHESHALREVGEVEALSWSGSLLALARREGGIALWDADTRALVRTLEHGETLHAPTFSRDGELLVARDRSDHAVLWHVSTGTKLGMIEQPGLRFVGFVRDTRQLVVASDEGTSLWELVRGRELERTSELREDVDGQLEYEQRGPVPNGSGSHVASVGEDGIAWVRASRSIAVAGELPPLGQLAGDGSAWLASDDRVLTFDAEGRIVMWSVPTGEQLATFTVSGPISALALSSDASMLATASGAGPTRIEVWTRTGERTHALELDGDVRALAFSPDGQRLASAGIGPRVEFWSLADGSRVAELPTAESAIHALAFSPDAALLAVAGSEVHLWQLDVAFDLATLAGAPASVRSLTFTPDGRQLVMLRDDGSLLRRWVDESTLLAELCRVRGCEHENGAHKGPH